MTKQNTVDVDDVLEQFDYAETITREVGGLTVELAEAQARRNPEFGVAVLAAAKVSADAGDKAKEIHEDLEIDVFSKTLLKSWNMTKGGKPVAVGDEAAALLKGSKAGRNLFRELGALCANPVLFKGASKKKPSSGSTRKPSKSATSRKKSSSNAKRATARRRSASKTT